MELFGRVASLTAILLLLLCAATRPAAAKQSLDRVVSDRNFQSILTDATRPNRQALAANTASPLADQLSPIPRGIRRYEVPVPANQVGSAGSETAKICPPDFDGYGPDSSPLSCTCSPEESTPGHSSVYGDGVYAGHSSLCLSARHAGVISGRGGLIVVAPAPTPDEDPPFPSVRRNGIQSYGSQPVGSSFSVSAPGVVASPAPSAVASNRRVMQFCPNNYHEFPVDGPPLTCGCTVEASTPGSNSVYGDQIYAGHSSLCLAARHAGAITGRGGRIIVTPVATPAQDPPYASVRRNGIQSYGSSPLGPSFRVASADQPVQAPIAEALRTQGRVQMYINFDTDKATLQASAEPILQELLAALGNDPELRVDLIGHTDAVGAATHNLDLSSRRAMTISAWLQQRGVPSFRLRSSGRGFNEPIADNVTLTGRALNRRVEVRAINLYQGSLIRTLEPKRAIRWR